MGNSSQRLQTFYLRPYVNQTAVLGGGGYGVSAVQASISSNHFLVRHDLLLNTTTQNYLDCVKISMDEIDTIRILYTTVQSTPAPPIFCLPFQDPTYLFTFGAKHHRRIPSSDESSDSSSSSEDSSDSE